MVKPPPASAFVVPQSQFLLEVLVVALDAPAHLGFKDHALQRHLLGQCGQPILHGFAVAFGPLDEQPLLGAQLLALIVPMGSTHADPGKARAQSEVGALAPFNALPLRRRQIERQLLDGLWPLVPYATGLRIGELVGAALGQIEVDAHGDRWLRLVGKGSKAGKVALPPLARAALDRYLMQRKLPITPARWDPRTPLIGSLDQGDAAGITAARLWSVMRRFFTKVAEVIEADSPATAEKLRRASPHWMRHTHATHALARGAELTTVRDKLRNASISTTLIYLHGDEVKRARQMGAAFAARRS